MQIKIVISILGTQTTITGPAFVILLQGSPVLAPYSNLPRKMQIWKNRYVPRPGYVHIYAFENQPFSVIASLRHVRRGLRLVPGQLPSSD